MISGLRLHDLCEDEKSVVFGEENLTASIPCKLLLALNLQDTDTLSVKLTQPKNNQIALAVDDSGKAVTDLAGTDVRLRYTPQSEYPEISVFNEEGNKIGDAEFDGEFLRFSANAAGTYTALKTAAVPEKSSDEKSGALPWSPLMGDGLFLIAGGSTMLDRRKYHG